MNDNLYDEARGPRRLTRYSTREWDETNEDVEVAALWEAWAEALEHAQYASQSFEMARRQNRHHQQKQLMAEWRADKSADEQRKLLNWLKAELEQCLVMPGILID